MNKKNGIVMWGIVPAFIGWTFLSMVGAAIVLRPQHIINRSVEKCVAESGDSKEDCTLRVNEMTQDQRIEYIRDR